MRRHTENQPISFFLLLNKFLLRNTIKRVFFLFKLLKQLNFEKKI